MVIKTNVSALNSLESNAQRNKSLDKSINKLSSGLRINSSSDDSSGLAISDKLRTQASSMSQSISNGNSAVALLQIADKAMSEQSNILDKVKQKLIQAKTDTTSYAGKMAIANDVKKLLSQLNNIADQTKYNGDKLLTAERTFTKTMPNGQSVTETVVHSYTYPKSFQMGDSASDEILLEGGINATTEGLYLNPLFDDLTYEYDDYIGEMMGTVDWAISQLNLWRGQFGSTQNQVDSSVRTMMTQETNLKAAESVIRDIDYASESASFSQNNIMSQAGSFALSQANSVKQNTLRLLQ
jgi:flagellin